MSGIMSPTYLTHYALLVAAIHILGGDHISSEDLQLARNFLDRFYQQLQDLYGERQLMLTSGYNTKCFSFLKVWKQ